MRQRLHRAAAMTVLAALLATLAPCTVLGQTSNNAPAASRALRQMQIHKVRELGLEIWVENQPPWDAELSNASGHPTFVAQSPEGYHPPTVMTYASWPGENVIPAMLADMASTAVRRASRNFGLSEARAGGLELTPARYGSLVGYESVFPGVADRMAVDVLVFVGQAPGRFPVALSLYTMRGKMASLDEQRRRAWGKLAYLP